MMKYGNFIEVYNNKNYLGFIRNSVNPHSGPHNSVGATHFTHILRRIPRWFNYNKLLHMPPFICCTTTSYVPAINSTPWIIKTVPVNYAGCLERKKYTYIHVSLLTCLDNVKFLGYWTNRFLTPYHNIGRC